MQRWRKFRRAQRLIHQWIGLSLGLPLVLLGLTGSLLVFYPEIDLLLNPELRAGRAPDPGAIRWREVVARLDALSSAPGKAWRIEVPLAAGRPIMARQARSLADGRFAPRIVTLDPATLKPTSDRIWGDFAVTWIYDLHYTLLSGPVGRQLVGWIGMSALLLLASGLLLWWPSRGKWPLALRPQIRRGRILACFDIHTKFGFYGLAFLGTLTFTGTVLALPKVIEPVVALFSPVNTLPELTSRPVATGRMIDADAALARACAAVPHAVVRWIETPDGPDGVYRIRMRSPGEPSLRFPKTFVWLDPWSGEVLATRTPAQQSGGDAFLAWQHPLHNGEAFGMTGRVLVLLTGLLPGVMLASGLMRWRDKRAAGSKRAPCPGRS